MNDRHAACSGLRPRARCPVTSIAYQLSTQLPDYQERLSTLRLERLVPESDARTLFDRLIVQPLSAGFPTPDHPVIILIDGLDEASEGGRNELARFISSEWRNTPDWLRLIVTSRPEPEVTHPLQGLDAYVLDASEPRNEEDIRRFLRRELAPFAETEEAINEATEAILDRSEGLFLYVEWVRQELAAGRLSMDKLDEFTQGLGGVYAEFFARQFPDERAFAAQIRPALEIIAAARGPLSLSEISDMLEWDEYAEADFVDGMGSLISVGENTVRPFHRSVMDWLTDRKTAGREFFVSVTAGHRRLAEGCWAEYTRDVNSMSEYALRYALLHLERSGNQCKRSKIENDGLFHRRRFQIGLKSVAICYSLQSYALADRLARDLATHGHRMCPTGPHSGPGWEDQLDEAISEADTLIVLMTPEAVRSPDGACRKEILHALASGVAILPVMVESCDPPIYIISISWLDMRNCVPLRECEAQYEIEFRHLLRALGRL